MFVRKAGPRCEQVFLSKYARAVQALQARLHFDVSRPADGETSRGGFWRGPEADRCGSGALGVGAG